MTPTLSEIRQLAGFPISGLPYDESVPRDSDIASLPFPLRKVFRVYERLRDSRGRVSWGAWIAHFTDLISSPMDHFAPFEDPLEVDAPVIEYTGAQQNYLSKMAFDKISSFLSVKSLPEMAISNASAPRRSMVAPRRSLAYPFSLYQSMTFSITSGI